MAKRLYGSYALALALSQALWVLPGAREAVAHPSGDPSCYTPPYSLTLSPCVPHDVSAGPTASVADLAVFAWQEFVALNWVAMDPASTGMRGRANAALDPNAGFLGIAPDASGSFPLLVWQTYRHKNELFPADGQTDLQFDSAMPPTYKYTTQPTPVINGPIPSLNLYNNLDEASQIGLDFMYAHASSEIQPPGFGPGAEPGTGMRVAYEAKVNRAVFDYANTTMGFTNPANGYSNLQNALANTQNNLPLYGGICSAPMGAPTLVLLPCGDITKAGDAGEGAIEIKAAWRRLDPNKDTKSHYFTRNVIFYTNVGGEQVYNNEVWGLVALHIIHKTTSFPAFVFASWEQVEQYDDATPANPLTLAFQNTGTPLNNIAVTRANPIHSQVAATNVTVQNAFKAVNPNTVWQYYKLVGVQAMTVNKPLAGASADDLSYYYLANIMVETNQTLQNFSGGAPKGVVEPFFTNVYVKGQSYTMGGCQGCHGFQAQSIGGDMSRILALGVSNANVAELTNDGPEKSIGKYRQRSSGAVVTEKFKLPDGVSRWQFKHSTVRPKPQ